MKSMKQIGWHVVSAFALCACSSSPATSAPPDLQTLDAAVVDTGPGPTTDAGVETRDATPEAGASCTAAREQLLKPIASVSVGQVIVLDDMAGAKTIYIDAAAGGSAAAATNPRFYLNLETLMRAEVTDQASETDLTWDLAVKRPILFTNSGSGGAGQGGAVFLPGSDFESVNTTSAAGKTFARESFFDQNCEPQIDQTGAVKTSFDGWYNYDTSTNQVTPKAGTWLVKGATSKLYKMEIRGYYSAPDGGVGVAGGRYILRVKAL
jgi:hypothetical protein